MRCGLSCRAWTEQCARRRAGLAYLIEVISSMWSKAAFLHPYALHSYYNPRHILTEGQFPSSSLPVLTAFILIMGTASFVRFRRRDLP